MSAAPESPGKSPSDLAASEHAYPPLSRLACHWQFPSARRHRSGTIIGPNGVRPEAFFARLNRVPGRKRNHGLSGNPQRRAEQLRARQHKNAAGPAAPRLAASTPRTGTDALRELAYTLVGGAKPAPWWPESHERVLARARALSWPSGTVEVEDLTCEIVGGELFDCFERYSRGHSQSQWLVALTQRIAAALRASHARGDDDWQRLWPLLCGIALTAPPDRAGAQSLSGSGLLAREMFPDIRFPHETALAEITTIKTLFTERSPHLRIPSHDSGPRAAGVPLAARDEYGSRFLLAAPFGYDDTGGVDHWYAWDVDACWIDTVTGLGTFGSAAEALREWRAAAGPAADGAELAACSPRMASRLLTSSLDTGTFAEIMRGGEPRELFVEYYREKRRALELCLSLGSPPDDAVTVDMDKARDEFIAWFTDRHGADAVAPDMADAVDAITDHWGPPKDIDEAAFYACSPHRVETTAYLLRHGTNPEYAEPAIKLLPEWTQWCVEHGATGSRAAARSRGAALTAAAAGAGTDGQVADPADDGPFRHLE